MDLEGRVREAMTAHEGEAPSAAEFVAQRRVSAPAARRATRWMPALAAASVVLAVAVGVVVFRSEGDGRRTPAGDAVLACPQRYESSGTADQPWVPAKPRGFDGESRLVPQEVPTRVLVCGYLAADGTSRTGSIELGGDPARVANALSWLPRALPGQSRACTTELRPGDGDTYLVGLAYPTGTVWVSAPGNHCAGASNGVFATATNVGDSVARAYAARRWTVDPSSTQSGDRDPCHVGTAGRLGQDKAMVPGNPVSATICKVPYSNQSVASATRVVTDLPALVRSLNSGATKPSTSTMGCGSAQPSAALSVLYEVLVSYAEGPPVFVRVTPGCVPSIDNLSLQGDDLAAVALVTGLLAGR